MANVLVVLEQRDGAIKNVSHEALAAGRLIASAQGGQVHALAIGPSDLDVTGLGRVGADRVFRAGGDAVLLYQAEVCVAVVAEQAALSDAAFVVVPATAMGKDLAPRIAARLQCALAADVLAIDVTDGLVVTRSVYSAKAVARVKITAERCVISVRPNAFAPAAPVAPDGGAEVQDVPLPVVEGKAKTVRVEQPERAAIDVAEASIVVSGGRGLKEPENFKLIEELAEVLGGAVGASRAVVDAGWRTHSEQVGQTGKTVSPQLYVAIGISGAIQHLAGMRSSKVIVAINKDRDAPIFKVADFGVVGDLFSIVPRLTEEIRKLKAR
ncbi:MAG TPA: electron transfer flavoprotein subunit alpha/FixB family protein [Gemmatimonadales bacterium]